MVRGRERPVLSDFITDDVVRKVFKQWLDGIDKARLRDNSDARNALKRFVINALAEINRGNDLARCWPILNDYTVNAKIPLVARTVEKIHLGTYLNVD